MRRFHKLGPTECGGKRIRPARDDIDIIISEIISSEEKALPHSNALRGRKLFNFVTFFYIRDIIVRLRKTNVFLYKNILIIISL